MRSMKKTLLAGRRKREVCIGTSLQDRTYHSLALVLEFSNEINGTITLQAVRIWLFCVMFVTLLKNLVRMISK